VSGRTRPTRRIRRRRSRSCTLSRLTTEGTRAPSSGPTRTSVLRPRTVDVTGPTITERRWPPRGSRVSTTTGRLLSRSASHSSPRRGAGSAVIRRRRTPRPSPCRRRGRSKAA
jgi:hypothetical protein